MPGPGSAPGWIRRTAVRARPRAGQRHSSTHPAKSCHQHRQPGPSSAATAWAPDRQRTARRGVGRQGEPPSRPFPAMCATLHKASAAATGPASPPSTGLGRHGQQHGTASPAAQHRTAQAARQPRVAHRLARCWPPARAQGIGLDQAHRSGQGWPPAHQARGQKHQRNRKKKRGRLIRNE